MKILRKIAKILVLFGGIDCGLYGLLSFHLIELLLGAKFWGRLLFVLIGISAGLLIYEATTKKKTN